MAACRIGTVSIRPGVQESRGFTLVELCIVIVVMGILVTIAVPNVKSVADGARRGSCLSNQRHLAAQSVLYCVDFGIENDVFSSQDLFANGYAPEKLCECPSSTVMDHDDYEVTLAEGEVTDIACSVEGDAHNWHP